GGARPTGIDHIRRLGLEWVDSRMSTTPRITKQSHTREQVLDLIKGLGVGNAIPSERQLSVDLGVSRLTVRAALDDLTREGYLVRRRGSGPYVRGRTTAQEPT